MTQAASGYARVEGDRYFTPDWVTRALLKVERFDGGPILDPGAGAGHIVDALWDWGYEAEGIDIAPGRSDIKVGDFFDLSAAAVAKNVVGNPPYGIGGRLAVRFIKQALALTSPAGGKVAMLLRVDFDSAHGRRPLFADHPAFAAKYVLTRRIRWANLEQSASGPTENHAWYVWDWRRRAGTLPTLGYLPLEASA